MRSVVLTMCLLCAVLAAADKDSTTRPAYTSNFDKIEIGQLPKDFMVLDGDFAVGELDGRKCIELAGDPIGTFGALFGPEALTGVEVRCRIRAASHGKRFPEFGIGANDAGAYKLILAPGRKTLELRKGDETKVSSPAPWTSATWTWFRLRVSSKESKDKNLWQVQGKIWPNGQPEPREWMVDTPDSEAPPAGKASIWGEAFSEQPIRYDQLSVAPQ